MDGPITVLAMLTKLISNAAAKSIIPILRQGTPLFQLPCKR